MKAVRMTRGTLARDSGVNPETIRYYEKAGLMPEPPRSTGGHRIYDQSHVKRLAFIRRCRELGFNLNSVRELLGLVDGGNYTCAEVLNCTQSHISDIRSKIKDLQGMEQALIGMADKCSGRDVPECPIVETLWQS